jgi:hypothetical protein
MTEALANLTPEPAAGDVTQADRRAAAAFYEKHLARAGEVPVAAAMRAGHIDDSPLIQAFRDHRLASSPSEPVAGEDRQKLLDRAERAWQRFFYPASDCFVNDIGDKHISVDLEVADCLRLTLAQLGRHVAAPDGDVPLAICPKCGASGCMCDHEPRCGACERQAEAEPVGEVVTSAQLIAMLDDPRIANAVNDKGAYGKAVNQNDAMRQELAHVSNLVSDLARAMHVDLANDDGSWPDLAGRIQKLTANTRLASSPSEPVAGEVPSFQQRVQPWLMACFGEMIAGDREERNHRFLEEALELVQACGCSASEAHQLVDYVYGRPVGELHQEIGGVMVTLAALCLANDADMHAAGWVELDRIWCKVEAIRAKQAAKPKHSPLPVASSPVAGPLPSQDTINIAARRMVAAQGMDWDALDGGDHGYWESMARTAFGAVSKVG